MLNFWNTAAMVYLFILLIGTMWMLDVPKLEDELKKPMWQLKLEGFFLDVIAFMWLFSMIAFPLFLGLGHAASVGDVWGLISIK